MLATTLRFGPADHGLMVTDEELEFAEYESGFEYEVIYGRLFVSPVPNPSHDAFEKSILFQLHDYHIRRPDVLSYVTDRGRVFVPSEIRTTAPEPDLALFKSVPDDDWRDVSPFIVGEVLRGDDVDKDLFRNVRLYWDVPTILEYWVFDIREDARRAKLLVYRRGQDDWDISEHSADKPYETPLLPGLKLGLAR